MNKDIFSVIFKSVNIIILCVTMFGCASSPYKSLVKAIDSNEIDEVSRILEKKNKSYHTSALFLATKKNKYEILSFLFSKGVDPNLNWGSYLIDNIKHKDDDSFVYEIHQDDSKTPLFYAIDNNNIDIVKLLLDNGALAEKKYIVESFNPLPDNSPEVSGVMTSFFVGGPMIVQHFELSPRFILDKMVGGHRISYEVRFNDSLMALCTFEHNDKKPWYFIYKDKEFNFYVKSYSMGDKVKFISSHKPSQGKMQTALEYAISKEKFNIVDIMNHR